MLVRVVGRSAAVCCWHEGCGSSALLVDTRWPTLRTFQTAHYIVDLSAFIRLFVRSFFLSFVCAFVHSWLCR